MASTKMWTGSDKYLCDSELAQAFHMARVLGMPLLMEGEPGTGKTELPIQFAAKFDHVKYLRDSQIEVLNLQRADKDMKSKLSTGGRSTERLDDYVMLGAGAKAYSKPHSLSHRKFILPESGKEISISEEDMPTIVITSNREQELPTAFKGRCVYHYITFPEPESEMYKNILPIKRPRIRTSTFY